jgi:hypothetical protein
MPRRNSLISRLRHGRAWDEWDEQGGDEPETPVAAERRESRSGARRIAGALTFAALFVAGAAFSAAAGDQVRSALEDAAVTSQASTDATATDATPTDTTAPTTTDSASDPTVDGGNVTPPPAPADPVDGGTGSADPGAGETAPPSESAPAPEPAAAPAAQAVVQQTATASASSTAQAAASAPVAQPGSGAAPSAAPGAKRASAAKPAPVELEGAASSVVWLNRALPDPTPPALRLNRAFAANLRRVARADHVSWALLLGVLRAQGRNGAAPATAAGLRTLAAQLSRQGVQSATPWAAMFALSSDTSFADRAVALTHYYRAVGLRSLVRGLEAENGWLARKVLNDKRVSIYAGGRGDIESGRVNVRVLAVVEYLADSFGQVTVSCLVSGHRLYARPGVISAHIYGLAADISEVGGTPIIGHQQPGGITERAVRDVLLLPPELMPKQVISLLGLGGPSFPLANHYDHIHIGY